jgi:hypothetical protein
MSGLYNMLMGRNPLGPYLMAALGFVRGAKINEWLGRFRDVYTNDQGNRIFILHRNYPEDNEYNQAIKAHSNFIAYIPDQDETYGVWEFSVPEQHAQMVKEIADVSDNTPLMERYMISVKGLKMKPLKMLYKPGKKSLVQF